MKKTIIAIVSIMLFAGCSDTNQNTIKTVRTQKIHMLEQQMEARSQRIQKLETEVQNYKSLLKQEMQSSHGLQEEVSSLQKELQQKNREIFRLRSLNEQTMKRLLVFQNRIKRLNHHNRSLKQQKTALQDELATTQVASEQLSQVLSEKMLLIQQMKDKQNKQDVTIQMANTYIIKNLP